MHAGQTDWLTIALHRQTRICGSLSVKQQSISLYSAPSVIRAICYTEHRPAIQKETQEARSSRYLLSDYVYAASPSHTAARVLLALMQTPPLLRPDYFPSLGARNP